MIQISQWKNDLPVFSVGDIVILRIDTDGNKKTCKLPLNDHLYHKPYTIIKKLGELVQLQCDEVILEEYVHMCRLRLVTKCID